MPGRRGLFSRIGSAISGAVEALVRPIERLFEGEPRRPEPSRGRPSPTRPSDRPVQRRREPRRDRRSEDPWLRTWRDELPRRHRHRGKYLSNRDFVEDMASRFDIPVDEYMEFWDDYIKYMVKGQGRYRLNDLRNPFWQRWNISPDSFDWWEWREAMGYEHGARTR